MKIFRHLKSLTVAAFALALLCVAFTSTTKASADDKGFTAAYNPETDMIDITAPDKTVIEIYVVKDAETELTAKAKKAYTATVSGTSVSVSLTDKKAGVKASDGKPLYLYMVVPVTGAAVEGQKANFKLAASEVKKIDSVTINYAKAYADCGDAVLTVKYSTATSEAPLTADLATVVVGDIVGKDKIPSDIYSGVDFTGDILYNLITQTESGKNGKVSYKKHKLNVQIVGSATGKTIDGVTYDGVRNSKVKAVATKSPAKATKAKVDYLKGILSVKNGFDYAVLNTVTTPSAIAASEWKTILPADSTNGTSTSLTVDSIDYVYVKKLSSESTAAEKASFYKGDKTKSLSLESICENAWRNEATSCAAVIYIRKTATDKAPASDASEGVVVYKAAAAPEITAATSGAISVQNAKGALPKLGSNISGKNAGAKAGSEYEILVVAQADLDAGDIDWEKVKWTKLNPAKDLKVKLSSKISYTTKNKETQTRSTLGSDGKTPATGIVILVRGAGVKPGKNNNPAGALPTAYTVTKFVNVGSGTDVKIEWQLVTTP